ncbi:hypothetical protein ABW19_dt0208581 [Dactylella cylindrospora]|nr:hypothetical protein ABW19_dt0208581 [Dactylella cylindrospora]
MPIKAYIPNSPPLRPTHFGLPPRRISALIIEEDLDDIDSSESSWFLPANLYETITISQKGPLEVPLTKLDDPSKVTTAADTSRRPSISLARLQTQNLEHDVDIKLPNYSCNYSENTGSMKGSHSRRESTSEVIFHSPLQRSRTYSDYSSSVSSVHSPLSLSGSQDRHSRYGSGYESPVFYPDSDCDCDCVLEDEDAVFEADVDVDVNEIEVDAEVEADEDAIDVEESEISKSASSLPIEVPKRNRRRRGCFVEGDTAKGRSSEEELSDEDMMDSSSSEEETLEDWVRYAYSTYHESKPLISFTGSPGKPVISRRLDTRGSGEIYWKQILGVQNANKKTTSNN